MVLMGNQKSADGLVKEHFKILDIIKKEGPIRLSELHQRVGGPKRTFEDRIKRLNNFKQIRKLDDGSGSYVLSDYIKYEHLIKEQLKRIGKEKGHHISRDDVRDVAESLRLDYEDDEYIKSFNKAMKEMGLLRL